MTILATLPRAVYPAGTHNIPSQPIPDGVSRLRATLQRNSWPDTGSDVIKISLDLSYDGGVTWPELGWGISARGGDFVYKGQVAPASVIEITVKPGTNRRVRGVVQNFVDLDTSVVVEGF